MTAISHHRKPGTGSRVKPKPQPAEEIAEEDDQVAAENPKVLPDRHAHSIESSDADGHVATTETEMTREPRS